MKKRLLLAAASCLLTTAVLAVGGEIIMKARWAAEIDAGVDAKREGWEWFQIRSDNDVLMWELRKNATIVGGDGIAHKTNGFGFRDREWSKDPGDEYRVAFVGDSVTEGYCVQEPQLFIRKLESMARVGLGMNVVAMNFGVNGYNAIQEAELLKSRVTPHTPNLVVYVMHLNDFDLDDASGGQIAHFHRPASFVWSWLTHRWSLLSNKVAQRSLHVDYYHDYFSINRNVVFDAIRQMHAFLAARNIPFRVVILPAMDSPPETEYEVCMREAEKFQTPKNDCATHAVNVKPAYVYPYADIANAIGSFFAAEGVPFLDVSADWSARGVARAGLACDPAHPNARGHAELALDVERFLHADLARAVRAMRQH